MSRRRRSVLKEEGGGQGCGGSVDLLRGAGAHLGPPPRVHDARPLGHGVGRERIASRPSLFLPRLDSPLSTSTLLAHLHAHGLGGPDAASALWGVDNIPHVSYFLLRVYFATLGRAASPEWLTEPAPPLVVIDMARYRSEAQRLLMWPNDTTRPFFPMVGRLLALWDWCGPCDVHFRILYMMCHLRSKDEYARFLSKPPAWFAPPARFTESVRRLHEPMPDCLVPAALGQDALRDQYLRMARMARLAQVPVPRGVSEFNLVELEGLRLLLHEVLDEDRAAAVKALDAAGVSVARTAMARLALGGHWDSSRAANDWCNTVKLHTPPQPPPLPRDLLDGYGTGLREWPIDAFLRRVAGVVQHLNVPALAVSPFWTHECNLRRLATGGDIAAGLARTLLARDFGVRGRGNPIPVLLTLVSGMDIDEAEQTVADGFFYVPD